MKMKERYRNGIFKLIRQHGLQNSDLQHVWPLSPGLLTKIEAKIPGCDPLVVFGDPDGELWTVLSDEEVATVEGGLLFRCSFNTSNTRDLEVHVDKSVSKNEIDTMHVGATRTKIWAPAGKSFFFLWGVLLLVSRIR